MELKDYQKKVIQDINVYLNFYHKNNYNPSKAYKCFWNNKGIEVGQDNLPNYNDTIRNVPNVTLKVPTGGGKTFIACAAIKRIVDFELSKCPIKAVVWMVPSDSILTQTLKALQNPEHPYRQYLDREFNHRVNIYSKEDALNAINLNVSTVKENLSIFVFSYSSFKNTKDGRKSRRENTAFVEFKNQFQGSGFVLHNAEDYSLLQTINYFNPLVIVDESHNAGSELSVDMINDFNPSFVLDLTATPRDKSNVISMVDAKALKKAEMIKLPLLVYNRYDKDEVLATAIDLQKKLELVAKINEQKCGRYIRPIVLFQAQERGDGNMTFADIKKTLLDLNIPEEQIKIKTADLDEISNLELLSKDCVVRFIITVNALKEGWDCPFAYVLASIANRTSRIDVEQIIGRVLRLPYTKLNEDTPLLNSSYVITSSRDFYGTANAISTGLKKSGYSDNDYRIITSKETFGEAIPSKTIEMKDLFSEELPEVVSSTNTKETLVSINPADLKNINVNEVTRKIDFFNHSDTAEDILISAEVQTKEFEERIKNTPIDEISEGEKELMKISKLKPGFAEIARKIKLPVFFKKSIGMTIFGDSTDKKLVKEMLNEGYNLNSETLPSNLTEIQTNAFVYDIDENGEESELSRQSISLKFSDWNKIFEMFPGEKKVVGITQKISSLLDRKFDCVSSKELNDYLTRLFSNMPEDDLDFVIENTNAIVESIKKHIQKGIEAHREKTFKQLLDKNIIYLKESFEFLPEINSFETSSKISKSLYESEPNINDDEEKAISNISSLDNIVFWHHIKEKYKGEFFINGFIHHYPDFVLYTKKGNVILIEFKGEDRKNDDSKAKVALGKKWADLSGQNFQYFMVFLDEALQEDGAYNLADVMNILRAL